jgi:subtilisin family serine protease
VIERQGPLLTQAVESLRLRRQDVTLLRADVDLERHPAEVALPLVFQFPQTVEATSWSAFRDRVGDYLEPIRKRLAANHGIETTPLFAANSLQAAASTAQLDGVADDPNLLLDLVELDPLVQVTEMDDVAIDLELAPMRLAHPTFTGVGVVVAVLDSGIDAQHPALTVRDAVSTSDESIDISGDHGTHCAGSIASRDATYGGVSPEVELLDIKVLRANGTGKHTWIAKGVDEALDRGARVLSMSLGFNHFPTWTDGGHGWACATGNCPLCTAVNNALAEAVVVVAAGNDHQRAEACRRQGVAFDTELGCPGHSRGAITVGAVTKNTGLMAAFSSRGPTAYGSAKPDLVAPGVNVTSTVRVPHGPDGTPLTNAPPSALFGRKSGTSMATPIVAGVAALMVQNALEAGRPIEASKIRDSLVQHAAAVADGVNVAGAGRVTLTAL